MVPDSLVDGGAAEGTKSPSTSGMPAPDTSMNNVFGISSSLGGMGVLWFWISSIGTVGSRR